MINLLYRLILALSIAYGATLSFVALIWVAFGGMSTALRVLVMDRRGADEGGGGPSGDALLLESGDYLLLESGDFLLLE